MTYSKKTGKAKRGRKTARATNARGIETLKARREKSLLQSMGNSP